MGGECGVQDLADAADGEGGTLDGRMCETDGVRRLCLRGRANFQRALMRAVTGIGTPRTLRGRGS